MAELTWKYIKPLNDPNSVEYFLQKSPSYCVVQLGPQDAWSEF